MRVTAADTVQACDREQLGHPLGTTGPRQPESDVLRNGEVREEGVILEDEADLPALGRHRCARSRDKVVAESDLTGVGLLEPRDQPQQRGLTAAARAEQREGLAALDAELGVRNRLDTSKPLRDTMDANRATLHCKENLTAATVGQGTGIRYASVQPLVTTRALARAFTYEVPDDVDKGAVVAIRLAGAKTRGVVVGIDEAPPIGVKTAAVERVVEHVPPALVELALWVADYYGSTPGRALALVAPIKRQRRKESPPPAERDALAGEARPERLTDAQEAALARLRDALEGDASHFLLHGATGSGKTEVYLQAAEAALERGRSVIVLVPEIALAPQTIGRFRERFGERIAVLHSALTDAERRDERERIASGEAPIVIGARSAIFAPVPELGLICVDEEHDAAYKQESDPRYDARTVAAKRASLEGAVAVYGSATPRPESWERLERLELGGRLAGPLPPVRVVDLRREAGYPLSAPLLAELGALAEGGGKAILLLNRRGVAPAIHCRSCGTTCRCTDCDVALVLHADALRCHHCGAAEPVPDLCPACASAELIRIGAGTQRLEGELARHVPELERI